jgi:hypothetical protein
MRSMAYDLKEQVRERAKKAGATKKTGKSKAKGNEEKEEKGLKINIVERVRSEPKRR